MTPEALAPATETTADALLGGASVPPPPDPVSAQDAPPPVASQSAPQGATPEAASTAATAPEANPFAGVKDSRGVEFHPAKFRIKDGSPQLDSKGRFVPLGAGRPKSDGSASTPPTAATDSGSRLPADEPEVVVDVTAELSADVAIGLIQTVLIMIGEEEGVLTPLEEKMLKGPLSRCLEKYNLGSKMTPELEAAAIVALLFQRRLKKPKTQSWFQSKLAMLHAWWTSRKIRRAVPDPLAVQ